MAKDAGGLAGALDYIGALNVATKITTVIGLAALAVIVAFLISSQWLASRRAQIGQAIDKGDDNALAALLGHIDVPLDDLSARQKFELGRDQSRQRFWQKMVWQALLFFGFLALLVLVWALVQPKPAPATAGRLPIDAMRMVDLLPYVPEGERQGKCERTLDAATCTDIVRSIAGLSRQASPKVEQQIATSLSQGTVSPVIATTLRKVSTMMVVTMGDPKGWDVNFRWCMSSGVGDANRVRAIAAARLLAQVPGERIASGVTLGRIAVMPTMTATLGLPYIVADGSAGGSEAARAIRNVLLKRAGALYGVSPRPGAGKWQVDVFHCGAGAPVLGAATS